MMFMNKNYFRYTLFIFVDMEIFVIMCSGHIFNEYFFNGGRCVKRIIKKTKCKVIKNILQISTITSVQYSVVH
jgi:hypothetical protein